jgi:hypothetical protein
MLSRLTPHKCGQIKRIERLTRTRPEASRASPAPCFADLQSHLFHLKKAISPAATSTMNNSADG